MSRFAQPTNGAAAGAHQHGRGAGERSSLEGGNK